MAKHVFSTLSADVQYTDTEKSPGGLNRVRRSVTIRGGAGVALIGSGQQVITPRGKRTEVTDEEAAFLESHPVFKLQKANGFLHIEDKPNDPEEVSKGMQSADPSKPKTPKDVEDDAKAAAAKTGLSPDETLQAVTNKKKDK